MAGIRSRMNGVLRKLARILPPGNPIRGALSRAWNGMLQLGGSYVEVPVADRSVRLKLAFRHLDPNYEAETVRVWQSLLKPGDVAWDVGANFGLFTILAGLQVGPTGRVRCWEPGPTSCLTTRDHIAANGLTEIASAEQAAVGETVGVMPFSVSTAESTSPINRLGGGKHDTTIEVPVRTLDQILQESDLPPNVVKIDIEGAEVFAFRGARRLLERGGPRPVVLVAVHPQFLPEFDCKPEELDAISKENDYVCFTMEGRPTAPLEYAEFLFVPSEKIADVTQRLSWKTHEPPAQ